MVIRRLVTGKMDLETSPYLLAQGDYSYALNICGTGTDGSAKPEKGNRKVTYTMPEGDNVTIGFRDDVIRDRAFYFVWNSLGTHFIAIFNKTARTITKLIEDITDTGGVSILNFEQDKKILHIDILYRDPAEGDILSWAVDNASPKELIIDKVLNGDYGVILEEYIEAAKRPPLSPPDAYYANDSTRTVNSLRKKLFQFKYRWVFDDFSRSTWSPVSKRPIPIDIYYQPDLDNDPFYNNRIDVSVRTGSKRVKRIEIAGRTSLGQTWGDFFLVDSVDKSDLSIGDNLSYTYKFYNDAVYPYVDLRESLLLHDWVPRYAGAQCLANGNVKVYGNITEGYDRVQDLNIQVVSDMYLNNTGVPPTSASMRIDTEPQLPGEFQVAYIYIEGTPVAGARYIVQWRNNPASYQEVFMDYTAQAGDTNYDIAVALAAQQPTYATPFNGGSYVNILVGFTDADARLYDATVIQAPAGTVSSFEGTWNWLSRYLVGVVYLDEQSRTNGVHVDRIVGRPNSDVTTQGYELSGGIGKTPGLTATISHQPPSWAKKWQFVRSRNMTIGDFLFWRTSGVQTDSEFTYFDIQSLYNRRDSQQSYVPNWEFVEGDRLRVVVGDVTGSQTYPNKDYLLIGIEEKDFGGGMKKYAKIKKDATVYVAENLIQLWRPAVTGGSIENEVFYEFGEAYDVYESGGQYYHRGGTQDQNGSQPAIVYLQEGDVYYRKRTFVSSDELFVSDLNYSDNYESSVNSDGRPHAIDFNAMETVYPTLVRFGGAYQKGTSINEMPRFYFDNLDEYDRQFGTIQNLRIVDRYMRVFQELKCGRVPVYQQVIKDAVGGDVVAQSDRLLNNIQYYAGEYGIGVHPESLASSEYADYFVDNNRGAVCRLSLDGLTAISVVHSANNYFTSQLPLRGNGTFIYGTFDPVETRYIFSMQAVAGSGAKTIAYNEQKKGFESFHSYLPEFMGRIGTLVITFLNGELWTHDSTTYCNYYGVQYKPQIKLMFNDNSMIKKTFQAVSYIAGAPWFVYDLDTSIGQKSQVPLGYFKKREDVYHAPLLRSRDSRGGLLSGDMLKGNWVEVTFEKDNGATGEEFHYAEVKHSISNLNAR